MQGKILRCIFSQFSNKYNGANKLYDPEVPTMMKTKRVEYVTTLSRFSLPEEYIQRMTIPEQAEYTLVNELKLWGQKYAILSLCSETTEYLRKVFFMYIRLDNPSDSTQIFP